MIRHKTPLLLLIIVILLLGCKKEHLQPGNVNGAPVFYFKGNVNGQPVDLEAGVNNYYMYSLYLTDANNVLNFEGTLQQTNCPNCANNISFTIKDFKIENNFTADSSLVVSYYPYMSPSGGSPTSFSTTFKPQTYDSVTSYSWNFGDGNSLQTTGKSAVHTYIHPGNYNVLLQVTANCNGAISNPVNVGTPLASLVTSILITSDTSYTLSMVAKVTGGATPYKYLWNFGDGSTSALAAPSHPYTQAGIYQISLSVTDANGLTSTVSLDTSTSGYSPACIVNFRSSLYAVPNPDAFSNIVITYTDASGDVYSSANILQPSASYFQILNVAGYQNNLNNQPTKQLHVQFSCMVQDSRGANFPITNGDAIIAVAYK